jgi:asparagine synthase (glutamine-hydrolysing)
VCGLVAALSLARGGPPVDLARVARATAALAHRGPDGETYWHDAARRVAFGHRRLAIIDRAHGAQPFTSEAGDVVAIANGEIYDHLALRRTLQGRGHALRTRCDAEVLVHLWQDHGPELMHTLEGELAFVLWDAGTQTLLASRDRFGVKPLVYAVHEGVLWLASEAKALFAAGLPRAWDEMALHHAVSLQYPPPSRTLFAGIAQLPAGHRLVVQGGALRVEKWWDLDLPRAETASGHASAGDTSNGTSPAARAEAAQAVRAALSAAVQRRLVSEVPVAVQLSGGLDSAAVLGLAAASSTPPTAAFTLGFVDADYDESARAARMAAHVGVRHVLVPMTPAGLVEAWPRAVVASEGLAINGHLAAKYLLHQAVRAAGFGVVLTGEGSDELFLGYPHFRNDLWRHDPALRAALLARNTASAGIMLADGEGLDTRALAARLGVVPSFLEAKAALGLRAHALVRPEVLARGDAYAQVLDELDVPGQLLGRSPVEQAQYLWIKLALANYLLRTLGDGTEMPHGVEGRLPFLDRGVLDVARALPVSLRIAAGVEKQVLRDAVADVVTPEIAQREKHPLMAPPLSREPRFLEQLQDEVASAVLDQQPVFEPARVRAWAAGLGTLDPRARAAQDPVIMLVLSVLALGRGLGL